MKIFISATGTDVGKTVIASWLVLHTNYAYFKPIQTGVQDGTDSNTVARLTGIQPFPEAYRYKAPLSPHLAASYEGEEINLGKLVLPAAKQLIIEGAGGLLVPINQEHLMIDLIARWSVPVLLVASTGLGTINHTLLSLEALRARNLPLLGVVLNGPPHEDTAKTIASYGKTRILASFPLLKTVNRENLQAVGLSPLLKSIFQESPDVI